MAEPIQDGSHTSNRGGTDATTSSRDRCLRKERPNSKADTIPRTAPKTSPGDVGGRTTTNLAVPPPIQDDSNTSTRDYCHATIPRRAKRGRRRRRRNAARLGTEPSPARPSACKLRHTTIANPQLSISCATFLPIIVSYAPAFSIEARQDVGALGQTYSEPCLHLHKPVPLSSLCHPERSRRI